MSHGEHIHSEHQHHGVSSPEITFPHEPAKSTKKIWKTFWLLLFLTIAELALGLSHYALNIHEGVLLTIIKLGMIVLSLAKAYYIVGIFMHLGDETKIFRLTILVTLSLFIWFITAFIWDGIAWRDLRRKFDRPAPTEQVIPKETPAPGSLN